MPAQKQGAVARNKGPWHGLHTNLATAPCRSTAYKITQVSEVDQSIDWAVLVAVRNQRSKDLRDIKVET